MKTTEFVQKIHDTPFKAVLAITGGGTGAINELLQYGGGSATILEAVVPYDMNAFNRFVKGQPDKYCSPEAARDLAMAAYQRGISYADQQHVIGVGATCSLMKGEPERAGREHYVYIAVQTRLTKTTRTLSYQIFPHLKSREEEERFASLAIIHALAQASELDDKSDEFAAFPASYLKDGFAVGEEKQLSMLLSVARLRSDRVSVIFRQFGHDCQISVPALSWNFHAGPVCVGLPRIILSGSFNPLHVGHKEMAQAGHDIFGSPVDLEICGYNVDKPCLNYGDMASRVSGIFDQEPKWLGNILLTNAATFVEKAEMFPTAKFLMGFDTLKRIGMEKYYFNRHHMLDSFRRIKELGCVFLVFHRERDGVTTTDADFVVLPEELQAISHVQQAIITGISSTEIRNGDDAK
jgi:hypothetical protein